MSSQDLAPAAPATTPAFRVPAWFYVALAIAVVPWLAYWIAIDPASPRWDGIDALFVVRGPAVAIVAGTVSLTLLIGIVRRWKAPPNDSAWFERNPGIAVGAALSVPLALGLLLIALVTRSARLVSWITIPVAIVAALGLFFWWLTVWLVPRVQSRPRWAAAMNRLAVLLVAAVWGAKSPRSAPR